MKIFKIFINQYFWLTLILLIGFWVRLYKIDSSIADWHSWRQADTAAVTRNFVKEGFNPFLPKYDDMSGVSETPLINPSRFRFVEFPIYNMTVYPLYLVFGVNETYHRLVSVLFSLGSIIFVYLIAKRYLGTFTSLLAAFVYALLPFNVFFSRTTLPEPTFVFFALGMVYFVDRWIWSASWRMGVWGFIFTSVAFLMKPWAIFFLLPLFYSIYKHLFCSRSDDSVALAHRSGSTEQFGPELTAEGLTVEVLPSETLERKKEKRKIALLKYVLFFVFALVPFIMWRLWILQQPEGIPASNWLLNGDGIRFRPAFFRWIIQERMGGEILGATGLVLFIIGLIFKPRDGGYFLHIWVLSLFLYFAVFATGNVRHNYYQIIFVPVAAIFLAKGFVDLVKGTVDIVPRIWTILLALFLLPSAFYFSWVNIKGFYQINNPAMVEAGKRADQVLPKDAYVVAPYNGDTAFLYQTNRPGWPVVALPLEEMVADYGVTHYVSTTKDNKTNWVIRHFKVVEEKPELLIADLTKLTRPFDVLDPEP